MAPPHKSAGGGPEAARPYTAMYLSGLRIGFSPEELSAMPYHRLACFIEAYNDSHSDGDRKATQADIEAMFM